MNKHNKTPYSESIAADVVKGIKGGVSIKTILASIADKQYAPTTYVTFMKVYGTLIEKTKAGMIGAIGEKVYAQALDGDFKSQEFYLRSKGGWSPNSTINEVELDAADEDNESAVDALMSRLGKVAKDKEEQ